MSKTKILIVEDEAIIALNIQNILELREYEIIGIAKSGKDAINMVSTHGPDLILMDIILSGEMDGITTFEKIKKEKNIPVVYLTAHSDKKTLHRAIKTEPHGYIIKPISQDELFSAIEIALYKHKMEMKLLESKEKFRKITEESLGLKLVNALTKQLDGDIKFTKGNGATITIKFPSRAM